MKRFAILFFMGNLFAGGGCSKEASIPAPTKKVPSSILKKKKSPTIQVRPTPNTTHVYYRRRIYQETFYRTKPNTTHISSHFAH